MGADPRPRLPNRRDQVADGALALGEELEDAQACGVAENSEEAGGRGGFHRDDGNSYLASKILTLSTGGEGGARGEDLYTRCALDALTLLTGLGVRADIESPCPASRQLIVVDARGRLELAWLHRNTILVDIPHTFRVGTGLAKSMYGLG